jgi:hypothetical protein
MDDSSFAEWIFLYLIIMEDGAALCDCSTRCSARLVRQRGYPAQENGIKNGDLVWFIGRKLDRVKALSFGFHAVMPEQCPSR